jgi:hypothetical protein
MKKFTAMKKLIYYLLCANILIAFSSCNSSREVAERRSLMMPKKSEMPRNSKKYKERERKYSGSKKRKES